MKERNKQTQRNKERKKREYSGKNINILDKKKIAKKNERKKERKKERKRYIDGKILTY